MRSDYAPALALVATRRGHPAAAARLLGAGDAHLARTIGTRLLMEQRVHDRAIVLLAAAAPPQQIEAWLAEGASLDQHDLERVVAQEL